MRYIFLFSFAAVVASGCAVTRKPLRQSTSPFEANEPAAQAQAARGEVQRGFTAAMVERALGTPPQIKARASGPALAATWIYPNSGGGATHIVFAHDRVSDILHVK